jgi:hypothetical protein
MELEAFHLRQSAGHPCRLRDDKSNVSHYRFITSEPIHSYRESREYFFRSCAENIGPVGSLYSSLYF